MSLSTTFEAAIPPSCLVIADSSVSKIVICHLDTLECSFVCVKRGWYKVTHDFYLVPKCCYWGCLLVVNLQFYLETLLLKWANDALKLPGVDYVVNNWALAVMLKALPLANFSSILLLKEQIIISVKKMIKTLIRSTQNQSIFSKICSENSLRKQNWK